jgi:DNA-binding response OmpR family regulator
LSADKVTGLQSGADDYIIKPFDPIELLRASRARSGVRRRCGTSRRSPVFRETSGSKKRSSGRCARSESSPVLYCDLDNFKTYNDQKGSCAATG